MRLTGAQRFVLQLLKQFRCLRDEQIVGFLKHRFESVDKQSVKDLTRLTVALPHQLYRPLEGYVALRDEVPNPDMLAACDLVLDYRKHGLLTYSVGTAPFAVSFTKQSENGFIRVFDVTVMHKSQEKLLTQLACMKIEKTRNAVIFLLDEETQSECVEYPNEHFFAVKENAGFRYFRGGGRIN